MTKKGKSLSKTYNSMDSRNFMQIIDNCKTLFYIKKGRDIMLIIQLYSWYTYTAYRMYPIIVSFKHNVDPFFYEASYSSATSG